MSEPANIPTASRGVVNVAEINPYAPRPFTFTEAAICLRDSIRAAGHESEIFQNRTDITRRTIVLGALPPHLSAVDQLDPAKTVIYNFEQLGNAVAVGGTDYPKWLQRWLVADYHSQNIAWLRRQMSDTRHSALRAFELPIVPSPSLRFRPDLAAPPTVDVLFYGSPNPRRTHVLDQLRAAGLSVEVVAGAFAEELAPAIHRARLVLHVHYFETALFPVARFLQPVVQGVPVVCETSAFSAQNDWSGSGIVFAPYDQLVEACRALLAEPDATTTERVRQTFNFARSIDFNTPFERLLRALRQPVAKAIPAPPVPIPAPTGPPAAPQAATQPGDPVDVHTLLSNEEIEAILAQEAGELPPEAHQSPPPLKMVERQPGKGRYGALIVALLLVFSVYTIWMGMRR